MDIVHAMSVSDGLSEALFKINTAGIEESSRNGGVLVMPGPVITCYYRPQNRVLFSPMRDANPFFHLMEALWMLGGRNDLEFPQRFNKRFSEYSDDGKTIWGAYGWRWRRFFGYDQLRAIVVELKRNPNSRRAVLAMWNAMEHHGDEGEYFWPDSIVAANNGRDVPCNTHAYFDLRDGALNMTVCCRSNDIIWGCYGANAVHFSVLQEYMAARLGVEMGVYRQFSNNFHLYLDVVPRDKIITLANDVAGADRYGPQQNTFAPSRVVDIEPAEWERDLERFLKRDGIGNEHGWNSKFFAETAVPMYEAYGDFRNGDLDSALARCGTIASRDWRVACYEWMQRRIAKRDAKEGAK